MNQKDAVYTTTMNVLAEHDIPFDDGQEGGVEKVLTKDMRASIIHILCQGFISGSVDMSDDGKQKYLNDEKKLKVYVSGLVSNWYRKDPRLNGGARYTVKNPGSRQGSKDEQLRALKALRALKGDDPEAVSAIDSAIAARQAELRAAKTEIAPELLALIPADLRAKLRL